MRFGTGSWQHYTVKTSSRGWYVKSEEGKTALGQIYTNTRATLHLPTPAPMDSVESGPATPGIAPSGASPTSPGSETRPLNKEDALAYLNLVKGEFDNRPGVYNNFLDTMKDFKSQACVSCVEKAHSSC